MLQRKSDVTPLAEAYQAEELDRTVAVSVPEQAAAARVQVRAEVWVLD